MPMAAKQPVIGISMNYSLLGSYHQFHIRNKYIDAVAAAAALPLPLPCTNSGRSVTAYLNMVDALIIIGGLDYPAAMYGLEDVPEMQLCDARRSASDPLYFLTALELGMPIVGICAGLQLMNIATGGSLIRHLPTTRDHTGEAYHPVKITAGKWLNRIFDADEITVNSNHHQAVDPKRVGRGAVVCATAMDGVIEALEFDFPQMVLGVQWHPERITDDTHRRKFFDFLSLQAEKYRQSHVV